MAQSTQHSPRLRLRDLPSLARAHPTLTALLATIILMEVAHGIELLALFPLYLSQEAGESASLVGLTIGTYLVLDILMRTPAGWLADRWGRKPVLLLGVALSALPLPLMMQVRDPAQFLALNAINGLGAGCIWPAIYASIADEYGKGRRGLIFGLVNTVMLGGLATGPISGGLLVGGSGSFAFSFLFCFALVIAVFAIVLLAVRETRRAATSPSPVEATSGTAVVDRQMVLLFVVVFCLTAGIAILTPILSFYGRDVLGLTPAQFALVLALPALATAAALIPFGRWADQHGRKRPLVIGLAVFATCLWLSPISTLPLVVSFGATLGGLGYALAVPAWNALTMDRIPHASRGTLLGVVAAMQGLGLVVGPEVGGRLWDTVSHFAPFLASAAVLTVGALCALFVEER